MSAHTARHALATALALVCGLAALVAPGVPAGAADAARARSAVTGSDFPSVRAVARIYPYFRGGHRELNGYLTDTNPPSPDCTGYGTSRVRTLDSDLVTYTLRDGQTAYFRGLADPVVAVYLYRSRAAATRAMREMHRAVRDCWGPSGDGDHRVTYRSMRMPRLGQQRFAFRRVVDSATTGRDYSAETWVRRGRYLVDTWVQKDPSAPAAEPVLRLTRAALRVID